MAERFEHVALNQPGLFVSCRDRADANDIEEGLAGSSFEFRRVGIHGFWMAKYEALDYLARTWPSLATIKDGAESR